MLRTSKTLDKHSAIGLAKAFLERNYPKVVAESHINAERIAGEKREKQLAELIAFVESEGQSSADLAKRFGLDEDHWCVRFFPVYEEGSASTIPPTILRVYDSDERVEFPKT
jgi:hypothetical protein